MPGPLWEATRDLHHACEAHPVGAAMASGTPPIQWYADWLSALYTIHWTVDQHLPEIIRRSEQVQNDLTNTNCPVKIIKSANKYVNTLNTEQDIAGAAYVLTGAHLMGGEIMRRRLVGYPTSHLEWDDRKGALAELMKFRDRPEIAEEAKNCFHALLKIMDEIQGPSK
jgi:heme oxygenase